jgi:hypothetical protein
MIGFPSNQSPITESESFMLPYIMKRHPLTNSAAGFSINYQLVFIKELSKMDDSIKDTYDRIFDTVYQEMLNRKKNDPNFTKQQLRELLDSLYQNSDNNWDGRGEFKEMELNATIAACEAVLYNWTE